MRIIAVSARTRLRMTRRTRGRFSKMVFENTAMPGKLHFNLILLLVDLAFENYAQKYLQYNYWCMFYKKIYMWSLIYGNELGMARLLEALLDLTGMVIGVGSFLFIYFVGFDYKNDHVHAWSCMWITVSIFHYYLFLSVRVVGIYRWECTSLSSACPMLYSLDGTKFMVSSVLAMRLHYTSCTSIVSFREVRL